jgi:chromosomal replication initiation ATPase DnaA
VRFITLCVAHDFWLDQDALLVSTRGAPQAAFARQVAIYLAHVCFGLSFAAVGRMFQRDRTTVAHACRVIEDRRDDRDLDRRLTALERACRRAPAGAGGLRGELEQSRHAAATER